ncbi:MAG: hypothetical protein IPM29_07985 [Planctomycetes bacterium]|nr:hypothetical protein [Planctomycetota bacterium]
MSARTITIPALASVLALATALAAQSPPLPPPILLGDLNGANSANASSSPGGFATLGGVAWFAATDGSAGRELFRSLGSPQTTMLAADIAPGAAGSDPEFLTAVGDRLYFFADDGTHGREPWVTDGTAAGTRQVAELGPGADGVVVRGAFAVGSRLVFFCNAAGDGFEPWVTDGTAAGTLQLADIAPGAGYAVDASLLSVAIVHDDGGGRPVLDFLATNGSDSVWWRTDGTVAGTAQVAVLYAGLPTTVFSRSAVTASGRVVFAALRFGGIESDIWSSDGTAAGTAVIATSISVATALLGAIAFGGEAYFAGSDGASLLATDGTAAGSRSVAIPASPGIPRLAFLGEARDALWVLRGRGDGTSDLLRVDAAAASAVVTGALPFDTMVGNGVVSRRVRLGDRLFLPRADRLWSIDVARLAATDLGPYRTADRLQTVVVSGRVLFPSFEFATGGEPWITDGSAAGTVLLRDLNTAPPGPSSNASSDAHAFTRYKDRVLFAAEDAYGPALWQTDGTPANTRKIAGGVDVADRLVPFGDRLAFRGRTADSGDELYVTDGTAAGTALVAEFAPGPAHGLWADPIVLGDRLILHAADAQVPTALFAWDGRTAQRLIGTGLTRVVGRLERLGDRVVALTARSSSSTILGEIWSTDGTVQGTTLAASVPLAFLLDFAPVVFADRLWFAGVDPVEGTELFATDGTAAGTTRVGTMVPGPDRTNVYAMTRVRDRLFVGTSAGLFVVRDIAVGPEPVPLSGTVFPASSGGGYRALGDRLLAVAGDPGGRFLLATDGTAAGTTEIRFPARNRPTEKLVAAGDRQMLVAVVDDATTREELWVTDGTQVGTVRYGTDRLGTNATRVAAAHGGLLYVPIQRLGIGEEPHVIDVGAMSEAAGVGCGGAGRAASLEAVSVPALGARCELSGRSSVGQAAVILLSVAPLLPVAFPAAGACTFEVDIATFVDLPPLPIRAERFAVGLDIPADPLLTGLELAVQAAVGPTDAALGADLTNGVLLTLGR